MDASLADRLAIRDDLLVRDGQPAGDPRRVEVTPSPLRAVERAGLDPAAVLTEITVPAMNARAGAAAADELRSQGPRPTAVFCTNDMLALGAICSLTRTSLIGPGALPWLSRRRRA